MAEKKSEATKVKRKRHPQHDAARQLFVEGNMELKQISEYLDVSQRSVGIWCREGKWERDRELFQTMPERLAQRLQQMAMRIMELSGIEYDALEPQERIKIVEETKLLNVMSDSISKISKSIVAINDRIDQSAAIQVLIAFNKYVVANGGIKEVQTLMPLQGGYIKSLSDGV
ncbi:MAG: hypothetical protein BGO32_08680 [Bacteroidetes bacterium 37-13]|nr:MAG: hypothetical protein BGO32_08680 [Bacteroidetes bacterium 37-13]